MIIGQQRISGREDDITPVGQLDAVFVVGTATQAGHDFLSERASWVQAKDPGEFFQPSERSLWYEQIGRHARAWLRGVSNEALKIRPAIALLFHTNIQLASLL